MQDWKGLRARVLQSDLPQTLPLPLAREVNTAGSPSDHRDVEGSFLQMGLGMHICNEFPVLLVLRVGTAAQRGLNRVSEITRLEPGRAPFDPGLSDLSSCWPEQHRVSRVRGRHGLGVISGRARIPEKGPSSILVQRLALRSRCAPRRPLTCPAEDGPASFAGLGGPAWAGERQRSRLVAAVELPGGHLCSGPRVAATAAASAPRTAPAFCQPLPPAPPRVVPGARILARPCRRRAALSPARGGSALTWENRQEGPLSSPPPAAAAASLSPPCFVLPSTLLNQPTRALRTQLRGGAGRSGEPGEPRGGGRARGERQHGRLWLLEPSPLSQPFFPPCSRAPAEAMSMQIWLQGTLVLRKLLRGRERKREPETLMREKHQSAAYCTSPTGDVPTTKQPRYMPLTGIEPETLESTGRRSIHRVQT
ncbi:hypothetical protein QTO34_020039, partial [Cnephaeus nilssonii]